MNKELLILLMLAFSFHAKAQPNKTAEQKKYEHNLNEIAVFCDTKIQEEKYQDLIKIADSVLKMVKKTDHVNQSLFLFYKATGFTDPAAYKTQLGLLEASLNQAKLANDTNRIINAQVRIMEIYSVNTAYSVQQKALADTLEHIFNATSNINLKGAILSPLANYYHQLGLYEKEITYRILSIKLLKTRQGTKDAKSADTANIGVALYNLGSLYLDINNLEKAKEYLSQSITFLNGYKLGIAYAYKDLAIASLKEGNIPIAEKYRAAIKNVEHLEMIDAATCLVAADLAFAEHYIKEKTYNKVDYFLKDASKLLKKYPDESMQVQYDYMMGTSLLKKEKYSEALPYLLAAKPKMASVGVDMYLALLQDLGKTYAGLGQWQLAYDCYKEYAPLRDSVFTMASKQSFATAEAMFQNKEKQQLINAGKAELRFNRKQNLYMFVGLILMALVIGLLVVYYRNKRKTARILDRKNKVLSQLNEELQTANQTKAKLFSIISHDLRSPISQVYQFLRLQQMDNVQLDEAQKSRLNQKVQTATGSLLETMEELLLWSKTQMNHFEPKITKVNVSEVVAECIKLLQLNIDAKNITIKNNIASSKLLQTDGYFLQTVFRNLLQNAIKASPEEESIKISYENNSLIIQNSGIPFTQDNYEAALGKNLDNNSLSGLGLKLAAELSEKINATISFGTESSEKTTTFLKF